MSRSEREKLEAEREARRARRLSERAQQRAKRQAEQADIAAERAAELARRANRRSPRQRDMERSIEDMVDDVTEKWSRKAEAWMDEQSRKMFSSDGYDARDDGYGSESYGSKSYGPESRGSKKSTYDEYFGMGDDGMGDEDMNDDGMGMDDDGMGSSRRRRRSEDLERERSSRRKQRARRRRARMSSAFAEAPMRRWKRRNRNGNLYRNSKNKKICGVCSGIADYWGMEAWQVRMMAAFGLFFLPSVAIPGYFIAYFLMDDKPYYRQVTDRFHELDEEPMADQPTRKGGRQSRKKSSSQPEMSNVHALRNARQKFSDIEERLRMMETHVTSPKFELQRELRKIAGDEA